MDLNILAISPYDWPVLWQGLQVTLEIAGFSLGVGLIFGFLLGVLHYLNIKILSPLIGAWIQLLRSIPLVLFVVALFLVLPFSPKVVAVLALGMYATASVADIVRGGLRSIDLSQMRAARILGMSLPQSLWHIALPQAVARMLPALVNQGSVVIKDTTLVSIGVMELTKAMNVINLRHLDQSIGFLLLGCAVYFGLCASISLLGIWLEKRLGKGLQPVRF
jgi:putative glutamine transport system permease protein